MPYNATSLEDAEAVIHRLKISENDLRKQQVAGFYRDIELPKPYSETEVEKKRKNVGRHKKELLTKMFTLLEFHVNLDLEGFEDSESDGAETGIKLPYIVTVEEVQERDFIY